MTNFAGNYAYPTASGPSTSNPDVGELEPVQVSTRGWLKTWALSGAKANTQPISDEARLDRAGNYNPMFPFLDFYNRIHLSATLLNLGNVVSEQQVQISVFNAFFEPRELESIDEIDVSGLLLIQPDPTPLEYAPLQERFYILQASTAGPPTINATYTFHFDIRDYVLRVVGVRVVAWRWEANWQTQVIERYEWSTDVMPSADKHEQRSANRQYPRLETEFHFDIPDPDERRWFENIIYAWGAQIWSVPVWRDIHHLDDELLAGETAIAVTTAGRDFHADGLAILIGGPGEYESVEVETVAADSITIKRPLVQSWTAGTRLYPARASRMQEPRSTARPFRNYANGVATFRTVEEIAYEALDEAPLYRGYGVQRVELNWREAPEIDYTRDLVQTIFGTGLDLVIDNSGIPEPVHSIRWTCLNRDEVNYFRRWLWARVGRARAVWLPTWCDDLIVVQQIAENATAVFVAVCGLVNFAQAGPNRRDIRMQLKSGQIFYRRVTNFQPVDELTERFTMDQALGILVEPQDIERISWLHLARLDSDRVEISWPNAGVTETVLSLRAPNSEA